MKPGRAIGMCVLGIMLGHVAMTARALETYFVAALPEVPLAEGLVETEDCCVEFETTEGRIAS